MQGLALGGARSAPTTAFLIEAAPEDKRGFYGCWQYASQSVATLVGGIVGFTLTKLLSADALQDWGWRLAFLFGAAVLPLGLAIRRTLPETLETDETATTPSAPGAVSGWRLYGRIITLGFVMISMSTVSTYVLSYMNTYATTTLHLAAAVGFAATITWGIVGFGFNVYGGWLSDRVGRKPVMIWPRGPVSLHHFSEFLPRHPASDDADLPDRGYGDGRAERLQQWSQPDLPDGGHSQESAVGVAGGGLRPGHRHLRRRDAADPGLAAACDGRQAFARLPADRRDGAQHSGDGDDAGNCADRAEAKGGLSQPCARSTSSTEGEALSAAATLVRCLASRTSRSKSQSKKSRCL